MSELFSDEFLSAYLDGELSPHERAAVERWIERAPEARQRLEDFRGLSRLFGDLPRTELPREFSTEVLHLAERRMLLPDAATAQGRQRIRGWTLALSATAAAAGFLLALTILNVEDRGRGFKGVARNNPPQNNIQEPARDFAESGRPATPDDQAAERSGVQIVQDEKQPRLSDQPGAGVSGGALPPSAAPGGSAGGVTGNAAPAPTAARFKADASERPQLEIVDSDRQLQDINAALQEIRESATPHKYLMVVRARAVDRAEGLVLLQKDFADNNILADAEGAKESKAVADDTPHAARHVGDKRRSETSSEGLYIEADADAVIAAFKTTLARRHPGVHFVVEPSIELASLDPESQKNLFRHDAGQPARDVGRAHDAAKDKDGDAKSNKKSSQPATPRKNAPSNSRTAQASGSGPATERHARVPVPGNNDNPDVRDSSAVPEGILTANTARQMVVPVVPHAIQNRARSSGDKNPVDAKSRNAKADDKQPDEKKTGDAKPLSPDQEKSEERSPVLVRMLIVIESEPQQPAVPAEKKGPSDGAS